ncbi:katanin p80 WD40 repeat-containing subunit B1 homolog KTN80.1-like isoform X1 [Nicotiana tabacum]|uniref:Katanin p80 WD40 repeat-containing subunit B1 homolog n=2 Tax=Nicotiana TaxID=4085 RepID=A0A1S3ZSG4_TOBAC|nr:PREDICTED: katanin p80 WD40 repeat-containing subunit B1 isoform X1 [Nicotiana sylvestris]XP_016467289.1 PREDICTED: katanin p80 WD40 repeat-containing subunit B1-like isoform X1 [Nicotiana tabacum]
MAKRGYKLQEFVAHSGNVNCLRFGKKTRRQFLTGGDDQTVNLWSIGKPTSTASLSGHTSPVESVAFDSAEVLVLAGSSSGVIKLWDLEETKMVRTLNGHRSYCTACEFHPFGEFFASGSMDTNLKLWDIRKKGCIHTYKGHTRGISTIRFSPDGRWVVSGGFDNVVKVWDLTAGKLLHDFKSHEGHVRSIDFHPLEFLLATGSADRTVNFWDLETFELIGSTRREAAGVRSMTFHPDGRTLFCGLDDSLKVYSWEPVICHDSVEMGWSTLSDLCIHDGKLVGGAYYQNYVGVWVADISLIEPYGAGLTPERQSNLEQKQEHVECRLERVGSNRSSNSSLRCTSPDIDSKEIKNIYVDSENPVTIKKVTSHSPKVVPPSDYKENKKQSSQKLNSAIDLPAKTNGLAVSKSFIVPSVVPRDIPEAKNLDTCRRESITANRASGGISQKPSHIKRLSNNKFDMEKISVTLESESTDKLPCTVDCKNESDIDSRRMTDNSSRECFEAKDSAVRHGGEEPEKVSLLPLLNNQENRNVALEGRKELNPVKFVNGVAVVRGRTRSLVERFEKREGLNMDDILKIDVVSQSKTEEVEISPLAPSCCKDEEPETFIKKRNEEPETTPSTASRFKAEEATRPLPPSHSGIEEANACTLPASQYEVEELEASNKPDSKFKSEEVKTTHLPASHVEKLEASPMPASQFESEEVRASHLPVSYSKAEQFEASPKPASQVKSEDVRKSRLPASRSKAEELEASPVPSSQIKPENVRRSRLPASRPKAEELEASPMPVSKFRTGARTSRLSAFRSKTEEAKTSRLLASRSKAEEAQAFRLLSSGSNAEEPLTAPLLNTDQQTIARRESAQNDNIVIEDLMQSHDVLLSSFRSRLTKLQVVRHFWERNDIRGAINALRKLPDHSVQADVVSVLVDKMEIITLDLFSCLLPVLLTLLDSKVERHANVSLELLLKLVAVFGPVVRSAVAAPPSVGVDLHAEERIQCCKQCFAYLQDIQKVLPALTRRSGLLAKGALQLNLLLQES